MCAWGEELVNCVCVGGGVSKLCVRGGRSSFHSSPACPQLKLLIGVLVATSMIVTWLEALLRPGDLI